MLSARTWLRAAVVASVTALAAPALAGPSYADREAARASAGKGYESFEAGDWRKAIELFQQAEARFHAPPHLLYIARAQAKLDLLLEAKATYTRVIDEKLERDAPGPFKEAQVSAKSEVLDVEARTPSLVVTLSSAAPPGTSLSLDGGPLAPGDLGRPLTRNPGAHVIVAESPGGARVEREVILRAGGGAQRVTMLAERPSVVPAVLAFVAGGMGIGVGTASAILLRNASQGQTSLRAAEIGGFAVGGVGVGAGVVLLVLRGRAPAVASARAEPWVGLGVGPTTAFVRGAF